MKLRNRNQIPSSAKRLLPAGRIWLIASVFVALMLGSAGCGLLMRPSSKPHSADIGSARFSTNDIKSRAVSLAVLQSQVTRFADQYAASIAQAADDYAAATDTRETRMNALRWKLGQATWALVDASGPSPPLNALDLLVLATLSRMVVEDHWMKHGTNEAALPLLNVHRRLETSIWELVNPLLRPEQQQEVRTLIQEWRQKNPDQRYVGAIRFREFVVALGKSMEQKSVKPNSVFSLLFLDPLAGLDPTAMAIEQTRLTAERLMYYTQRMPFLLNWQVELLAYQLADQPESRQLIADANRLAVAAENFGKVAEQIPKLVSSEREAAIQQVLDGLVTEQAKLTEVLRDANKTLSAGHDMATSVNGAIRSLDEFVRFVSPSDTNRTSTSTNHRPFDVLDYGRAAGEIGTAARELEALLMTMNSSAPQLSRLSEQATTQADRVVRHAAWLGMFLILFLLTGAVLAALVYRIIARRWLREGSNPSTESSRIDH